MTIINTHEVVNAAHGGIRNQQWDAMLRAAKDTGEAPDVVIVGCGMAGLSACWAARIRLPTLPWACVHLPGLRNLLRLGLG